MAETLELASHAQAKSGVEIGQGLVHQEGRGIAHDRAGQRHALALAARQLPRTPVQQVFDLVRKIRGEGFTVLIVEQNVQQLLHVVDRAYLLEAGTIRASGAAAEMLASDTIKQAYLGV